MYIERALEPIVREYSEYFKVVVVVGPRQVGKTTMLKHLIEEDASLGIERSYVSLDNTSVRLLAKQDPELFLQRYRPPVLIDEIQKAPELLPYIKEAVDASAETGRFWLTGSQPLHLMKEVSESLAGRAGVIEMLGLSGAEIDGVGTEPFVPSEDYFMRRMDPARSMGVMDVYERIAAGSFPGIALMPEHMRAAGYESYIDTYVMRDIRDLAQVGDELKFRRFMIACAAMTSKPVVYAELARQADIDEKTAKTWLSLLVSTYLVKIVPPFSNNLLKRLSKQPIMHFIDTGLAAYLVGWDGAATLEAGAMSGQIFETYVFGELYKSYANVGKRAPFVFFRTNDRKEIDLLLESNGRVYPIEVKKSAGSRPNDTKNFSALDPLDADEVPSELVQSKREIGTGAVVCLASDARPINRRAWAFPVWSI